MLSLFKDSIVKKQHTFVSHIVRNIKFLDYQVLINSHFVIYIVVIPSEG